MHNSKKKLKNSNDFFKTNFKNSTEMKLPINCQKEKKMLNVALTRETDSKEFLFDVNFFLLIVSVHLSDQA